MVEKIYETPCGPIRYWVNSASDGSKPALVFLPGLTADHRLFDRQIAHFEGTWPVLVWDAPGHGASWPFSLTFTMMDKARWLHEILCLEGMTRPVIVGQSMGGYVGQAYAQQYPCELRGFVSIDSAPLQRVYTTSLEIWLLKRMEPVYRRCPWNLLVRAGVNGTATSPYGKALMREMMETYDGDQARYAQLSGHGFRILAEAMEADLPYRLTCPVLLICGKKDRAGSCIRYNRAWSRRTGFRLEWIREAGHNANTDKPEQINDLIEELAQMAVKSV